MENLEVQNVVKELCEGRELTMQLHTHLLHHSSSSSSQQNLEFLLHGILSSYDHALAILAPPPPDSPASPDHTEDSDQDQLLHAASTKRKVGVAKWSEKIKLGGGIEEDGYAWRKYGQKDILGAKYPRGYYRCRYRHTQGCLATKQVQKCDDDPTTLEITYRRNHTCNPPHANNPPLEDPININPEEIFNIQTSLRVITPFNPHPHPQNNNIVENYSISEEEEYSELSPIVAMIPNSNSPAALIGTDFQFAASFW